MVTIWGLTFQVVMIEKPLMPFLKMGGSVLLTKALLALALVLCSSNSALLAAGPEPSVVQDLENQAIDDDKTLVPTDQREETEQREPEAKVALAMRRTEELSMNLGIELVRIPGGEFMMGSNGGEFDEKPAHRVRVSDFYLAKTEVTQAQWRTVMGVNPSIFNGCEECPVERVSWNDVQDFLRKASQMTGLDLRLPTEAEWEYAAGGGEEHQMWAGTSKPLKVGDYAWFIRNSGKETHPVGSKKPNRYGLYDMSGNVWEWCSDYYDRDYYHESPIIDPKGPSSGKYRVLRGGSWYFNRVNNRVTVRNWHLPIRRYLDYGFRVALDAP
jgi:formylglycine-generating enzyme required for sulfatase activity